MKKVLFGLTVIAIATLGVVKAIDVNETNSLSNLQLENVEALADAEPGAGDCVRVCEQAWGYYCAIAYRSNLSEVYYCLDFTKPNTWSR